MSICVAPLITWLLVATPANGLHTEVVACFAERVACEQAMWVAERVGGHVVERCTEHASGDPLAPSSIRVQPGRRATPPRDTPPPAPPNGVLRPAVEAYLLHQPLTGEHIAALRAYLRQWIAAPAWRGPGIAELRAGIDGLTSREAIANWLDDAGDLGIDPL